MYDRLIDDDVTYRCSNRDDDKFASFPQIHITMTTKYTMQGQNLSSHAASG
jgi:hypothetical protein